MRYAQIAGHISVGIHPKSAPSPECRIARTEYAMPNVLYVPTLYCSSAITFGSCNDLRKHGGHRPISFTVFMHMVSRAARNHSYWPYSMSSQLMCFSSGGKKTAHDQTAPTVRFRYSYARSFLVHRQALRHFLYPFFGY